MSEKTELQRNLSKKAQQLLRCEGRLVADSAISVDTTTLRILRTWDVSYGNQWLSIWHRGVLVYEEVGGEALGSVRIDMRAAYDDLCRHMVLEDLADV